MGSQKNVSIFGKTPSVVLAAAVVLLFQDLSFAQDRNTLRAERLPEGAGMVFDGRVTEAFWKQIEPATNFRQQEPREGEPATERN
ncbi:MAG: hypothetical protein U5K69_28520 [Balneolaceae bacterium]|nr:hypothetical protein [Balneolaceae bacterium]